MDNKAVAGIMKDIYNVWWRKWAVQTLDIHDGPTWQQIVTEVRALLKKYDGIKLARDMVLDLADELERRARQDDKEGGIENAKL